MFSIYLIILLAVLAAWKKTRRFAFYFLPWFLFGIIYDSMRLYPNYMVNDIDVAQKSRSSALLLHPAQNCRL